MANLNIQSPIPIPITRSNETEHPIYITDINDQCEHQISNINTKCENQLSLSNIGIRCRYPISDRISPRNVDTDDEHQYMYIYVYIYAITKAK